MNISIVTITTKKARGKIQQLLQINKLGTEETF